MLLRRARAGVRAFRVVFAEVLGIRVSMGPV